VEEGRRTFANILKYVRMGASSNFGNIAKVACYGCSRPAWRSELARVGPPAAANPGCRYAARWS
jgi:hypothetical protein